ncbi:MAG: T9SS type A sorting domain-containing protein, partial [Bacteroidota bacterium]
FFLADNAFNYIDNTTFFEDHISTTSSVMLPERDNRAIDIFIVQSANIEPDGEGTVLAYYSPNRDWIVITDDYIEGDEITLTHEIGHFFSLDHTFFGWEAGGYNVENDPAPIMSSGSNTGQPLPTERVNGTNCETAADLICDTPPDYGNGLGWSGCDFTLNVLDPLGAPINPDERNYLSYFLSCPDEEYRFSDQQVEVMHFDLNSSSRNYLRINPVPELVSIEEEISIVYPTNNQDMPDDDTAYLTWDDVPGATAYVVEISRVNSFTVNPIRAVVYDQSNYTAEGLDPGKKYFWRVRPFNAHVGCAPVSATESFTTNSLVTTRNLDFVNDFRVSPNPVAGQQELNVQLNSSFAFNGQVQLIDMTGRPVSQAISYDFGSGEQRLNFPLNNLSNGLYLLRLITAEGQVTKKVVIAN